jgi:hypothetical protein
MIYEVDPITPLMNPKIVVDCTAVLVDTLTLANTSIMTANVTTSMTGMSIANTAWTTNAVATVLNAGSPVGNYTLSVVFTDNGGTTYGPYSVRGKVKASLP